QHVPRHGRRFLLREHRRARDVPRHRQGVSFRLQGDGPARARGPPRADDSFQSDREGGGGGRQRRQRRRLLPEVAVGRSQGGVGSDPATREPQPEGVGAVRRKDKPFPGRAKDGVSINLADANPDAEWPSFRALISSGSAAEPNASADGGGYGSWRFTVLA